MTGLAALIDGSTGLDEGTKLEQWMRKRIEVMAQEEPITEASDLRSLRTASRLSIRELAVKAGVAETDVRIAERGLAIPSPKFLDAVANALQVDAECLRLAHENLTGSGVTGEGYRTARPDGGFVERRRKKTKSGSIKVLDLFCGTGGFSHGFEQTKKFQVVGGIDLLPDRIETFILNHAFATAVCGDIRSSNWHEALQGSSPPDVVIGGPPCQGFSSIRPFRNLTEDDDRNNLFEQFALVVDRSRPKWFVLENVVGLLRNKGGETLAAILSIFEQIGYKTSWKILNTAFYGLPQRRERFVLVGNRQGVDFNWPQPTNSFDARSMAGKHGQRSSAENSLFDSPLPSAVSVMEAIHDLPEIESGGSASTYRSDVQPTAYEKMMRGDETVLTLHEATSHSDKMMKIIRLSGANISALPKGLVTSGFSSCYSRLEPDEPSVTITVNFVHPASNKCIHPYQHRALTPREGARLQGFPDNYKFAGSKAQIVKQIGNAVPPLLGKIIATAVADQID